MQKLIVSVLGALLMAWPVVAASQQGAPSSATDVTRADIEAVLKSPEGGIDRQIKVVDIGHGNVGVGILHRGPTKAEGGATSGIVHSQVTEVYYIVSGGGILMTGGTLENAQPSALDSESIRVLVGPSLSGTSRNGHTRRVSEGDIVVIPAGVFHGWTEIPDHVTYLSVRPDPEGVLPAGYVNPAVKQ